MRTVSPGTMRDMFAQETSRTVLVCLTISHPSITPPIRLVSNTVDLSWGGNTFIGMPFEITLADEDESTISDVVLNIDNVDRRMVEAVRTIQAPPMILLQMISVDAAGTITQELGDMQFRLQKVDGDALVLSSTLGFEADYLNEPAVRHHFDPATSPGLF